MCEFGTLNQINGSSNNLPNIALQFVRINTESEGDATVYDVFAKCVRKDQFNAEWVPSTSTRRLFNKLKHKENCMVYPCGAAKNYKQINFANPP